MARYVLSAQPIDEQGRIGFEQRDALEIETDSLDETFRRMARALDGTEAGAAWDLTLTVSTKGQE